MAAWWALACSDDSQPEGPPTGLDAGARLDAAPVEDAGLALDGAATVEDAGAADATSADTGSALTRHCAEASAYLDRCAANISSFCARAELNACGMLAGIERPEVVEARASCGFPAECTTPPTFEMRLCVYQQTEDLEPTPLQRQLAGALCAACAPGQAECLANHFFRTAPRDDGMEVTQGAGTAYLLLRDEVVQRLLDGCVPAVGASLCYASLYECVEASTVPEDVRTACEPIGPGG